VLCFDSNWMGRTEEVKLVLTVECELVACVSLTVLYEVHNARHVCRTHPSVCLSVADMLSATEPCRIFMKFGRVIVYRISIKREFFCKSTE